jgi:hypothetical protein
MVIPCPGERKLQPDVLLSAKIVVHVPETRLVDRGAVPIWVVTACDATVGSWSGGHDVHGVLIWVDESGDVWSWVGKARLVGCCSWGERW